MIVIVPRSGQTRVAVLERTRIDPATLVRFRRAVEDAHSHALVGMAP
jgi:hypothetical protein